MCVSLCKCPEIVLLVCLSDIEIPQLHVRAHCAYISHLISCSAHVIKIFRKLTTSEKIGKICRKVKDFGSVTIGLGLCQGECFISSCMFPYSVLFPPKCHRPNGGGKGERSVSD